MNQPDAPRFRIQAIDILRGIVIVIMALDHVRDFFFKSVVEAGADVAMDPTNMQTTFPGLFFTRWITHYCAPVFVFLAGTSCYLMSLKRTRKELSLFLIKRGFWLILVEVFIITLGWTFNPLFNVIILQVIWAIGISMVLMGLVVLLPFKLILTLGLIIVLGHNLLDYPGFRSALQGGMLSDLLYFSNFSTYEIFKDHFIIIVYAFLPWFGVLMSGYCFGRLYRPEFDPAERRKWIFRLGVLITLIFILLRFINEYGDPVPWAEQPRGSLYTYLSFLNVNKYPPSLAFLCMTIGPALILLSFLESIRNRVTDFFNIYGRVPLFFYILHFYIIHTIVVIVFFIEGFSTDKIVTEGNPFLFRPNEFGFDLWGVYIVWILVIAISYPLCKKYDRYKTANIRKKWWLAYL